MFASLRISFVLLLFPLPLLAQPQTAPPQTTPASVATFELEAVISEAGKLDDKMGVITVKAKAAALISLTDPSRSDAMFVELWKMAKDEPDTNFEKERALMLIIKHVLPHNQKLAKQFLGEPKHEETDLQSRATGRDPTLRRTARLASQLMDEDPRAASELLERSLPIAFTPAGLNALLQLRERDALLADSVAAKTIEGLQAQPDVVSLSGLQLLSAYLFPGGAASEITSSLQSLQRQYFFSTHQSLLNSMAQSEAVLVRDRNYTQGDLRLRAMYQSRVALTLSALAPRFRPELAVELNALANKLAPRLPSNVAQLAQLSNSRLTGDRPGADTPEQAISIAISSGDFEEAARLTDQIKNEDARKSYSQLLAKLEAKSLLAKSEILGALGRIRKVDDDNARLILYLEALKVAQRNRDKSLIVLIVDEARTLIPQVERNGLHVRALLTFVSQLPTMGAKDSAFEFLDAAVISINALPKGTKESSAQSASEMAWEELNDARTLMDVPEFARAFSTIGMVDFDRATLAAHQIRMKQVQLVARLETVAEIIRRDARTPRRKVPNNASRKSQ